MIIKIKNLYQKWNGKFLNYQLKGVKRTLKRANSLLDEIEFKGFDFSPNKYLGEGTIQILNGDIFGRPFLEFQRDYFAKKETKLLRLLSQNDY